jgi:TrpR family transcriptional regulator, trp operon repressor
MPKNGMGNRKISQIPKGLDIYHCTITIERMNSKYLNELAEAIVDIKDRTLAKAFLKNILTPAELEEIPKRLQIVKLLEKGVPQREVAKKLNVSIGTVSRGSRELKYGVSGFKEILKNES